MGGEALNYTITSGMRMLIWWKDFY
jgi:hypothetical protein